MMFSNSVSQSVVPPRGSNVNLIKGVFSSPSPKEFVLHSCINSEGESEISLNGVKSLFREP